MYIKVFSIYFTMTGGKNMVCHTEKLHGGLLNQGSTVTTAVGGSVPINPQNLILACQKTAT